jgi:hypothetical protein
MQGNEATPTVAQGLLRLGTLFVIVAVCGFFFWDMFSETAALNRLATTARSYHYTESCDAEGNLVSSKLANCIDLNHYVFVYGPVMKAMRRRLHWKASSDAIFRKG